MKDFKARWVLSMVADGTISLVLSLSCTYNVYMSSLAIAQFTYKGCTYTVTRIPSYINTTLRLPAPIVMCNRAPIWYITKYINIMQVERGKIQARTEESCNISKKYTIFLLDWMVGHDCIFSVCNIKIWTWKWILQNTYSYTCHDINHFLNSTTQVTSVKV